MCSTLIGISPLVSRTGAMVDYEMVDPEEEVRLEKFKKFIKTYPSDCSPEEIRKRLLELAPESLSDLEITQYLELDKRIGNEAIRALPFYDLEINIGILEALTSLAELEASAKFLSLFNNSHSILPQEILEREFKEFICGCLRNKELGGIGKMIMKVPEGLSLDVIIDFIFQRTYFKNVCVDLDAVLASHPSYVLSPLNQIRRAIAADKAYHITNEILMSMLQKVELGNNKGALALCVDVANRFFHPNLYLPSATTIHPDSYTINFIWVNLNPQDRVKDMSEHIFKDGSDTFENSRCLSLPKALQKLEAEERFFEEDVKRDWEKIKASFSYRVMKWAELHPKVKVNLWYDSALVTRKAQLNTFRRMKTISRVRGLNLCLRDIRQLPNLEGEIEHSLHPGTNVYYRVDILRVLITDHMISCPKERARFCVMSDVDVEPMAPQQLFDQRTLDFLSSEGYVFNSDSHETFENSFSIFNRDSERIRKLHYQYMIQRVGNMLTHLRYHDTFESMQRDLKQHDRFKERDRRPGGEFVFDRYEAFLFKPEKSRLIFTDKPVWRMLPRKVAKCPKSQFAKSSSIPLEDFKAEIFYFKGCSNVPLTLHGRNFPSPDPKPIEAFAKWKAEPLPDPSI